MNSIFKIIYFSTLVLAISACNQIPSEWTTESKSEKNVSWKGSYDNSKKLDLIYHGVKFYDENDKYEWAFRVKVVYPQNQSDDTLHTHARKMGKWVPPSNAKLCISVNKIIYGIYDKDDFLIDSISIEGECVTYQDTITFQGKESISKELLSKYAYGKVNLQAGHN